MAERIANYWYVVTGKAEARNGEMIDRTGIYRPEQTQDIMSFLLTQDWQSKTAPQIKLYDFDSKQALHREAMECLAKTPPDLSILAAPQIQDGALCEAASKELDKAFDRFSRSLKKARALGKGWLIEAMDKPGAVNPLKHMQTLQTHLSNPSKIDRDLGREKSIEATLAGLEGKRSPGSRECVVMAFYSGRDKNEEISIASTQAWIETCIKDGFSKAAGVAIVREPDFDKLQKCVRDFTLEVNPNGERPRVCALRLSEKEVSAALPVPGAASANFLTDKQIRDASGAFRTLDAAKPANAGASLRLGSVATFYHFRQESDAVRLVNNRFGKQPSLDDCFHPEMNKMERSQIRMDHHLPTAKGAGDSSKLRIDPKKGGPQPGLEM